MLANARKDHAIPLTFTQCLISPTYQNQTKETTQMGIVRLGYVAQVKLSFLSLKSPGSTLLLSSAIVICCEKAGGYNY